MNTATINRAEARKQHARTKRLERQLYATYTERRVDELLEQLEDQRLIERLARSVNWRA
jgi:hypothetical protein